jgi:MFS family permease
MMGSIVSMGLILGPPLGGLIVGLAGWPWIFWVNVPIGILAVAAVIRFVPDLSPVQKGQRFDYPSSVTLFAALTCYALGMTYGQAGGFEQHVVWVLLGAALAGLAAFLLSIGRAPEPLIDLTLFKNILFSINLTMGFLVFIVLAGLFIMPFYLQMVKGYKPEQIGFLMIVGPLWMGLIAPLSGSLSDRFGPRIISVIGLMGVIVGCWTITTLTARTDALGYVLRMSPIGIGLGLFSSPNMSAIMGAAPRHRLGVASGLVALSRTLGQTTGVPLMGAIFAFFVLSGVAGAGSIVYVTSAGPEQLIRGIRYTFGLAEVGVILSTILALVAMVIDLRRKAGHSVR